MSVSESTTASRESPTSGNPVSLTLVTDKRIVNYGLGSRKFLNRQVQVADTLTGRVFHTGIAVREDVTIEEGVEKLRVVSRTEPWLFGEPIIGRATFDRADRRGVKISLDLIFNPIVDRRVQPNRAVNAQQTEPRFIDVESTRTPAALSHQGTDVALWKLSDVLLYLFAEANRDQKYIDNPPVAELLASVDDVNDTIRHLHLPHGLYLPAALDHVLTPLGYSWFIWSPGLNQKPRIRVFAKTSQNRINSVVLQAPGSALRVKPGDEQASNVIGCNLSFDASQAANRIGIVGDYFEIESTWELKRGWPEENEQAAATNLELIRKGNRDWEQYETTWRLWVLNEDGSYNSTRPEITKAYAFADIPEVQDYLKQRGVKYVPRRRRFTPCLTLDPLTQNPYGQVRGMRVEYQAKEGTSGELVWKDCTHDVRVLRERCGVYFSDIIPPQEIMALGSEAAVRITATIRLDWRLQYLAERNDTPLTWWNQKVLVLDDRFGISLVSSKSRYADGIKKGDLKTRGKDDRGEIEKFAKALVESWNMASINGTIELEGVDHELYELGTICGAFWGAISPSTPSSRRRAGSRTSWESPTSSSGSGRR